MARAVIVLVIMVVEVVALFVLLMSKDNKNGYAVRCVGNGIFCGIAISHLIPISVLYIGAISDILFNFVFAIGFAYFSYGNYKRWKNAK